MTNTLFAETPLQRLQATPFTVPACDVLDARCAQWQRRKWAWGALGFSPSQGRTARAYNRGGSGDLNRQYRRNFKDAHLERALAIPEVEGVQGGISAGRAPEINRRFAECGVGASVFDPVLCETMIRWFTPHGGARVLDPFAGGPTSGIVAAALGFDFVGVEIRPAQVAANQEQAARLGLPARWVCGDSADLDALLRPRDKFDLLLTDPPYASLEVNSTLPGDLSAMKDYDAFMGAYRAVFAAAVKRLRKDRFVVVKVGEVRDKSGCLCNFVSNTITTLSHLGLTYYARLVLMTKLGSLPIRVGRQFAGPRKLGNAHQYVLVFYKGNLSNIPAEFGGRDAAI